jgi:hypothetical protein
LVSINVNGEIRARYNSGEKNFQSLSTTKNDKGLLVDHGCMFIISKKKATMGWCKKFVMSCYFGCRFACQFTCKLANQIAKVAILYFFIKEAQ